MAENDSSKKKDQWEKADVVGKWLIPVTVALATVFFNSGQKAREAKEKSFEVAISILQAPKTDDTKQLREWALSVFTDVTGTASSELPKGAEQELREGVPLPSTPQPGPPGAGQLRVSIIRLEGAPPDQSERIRADLASAGGYTVVSMTQRSADAFPSRPEVRFYYPADSQNAQALSDHLKNSLGIATQVNNRSQDEDALKHRPGELHIYVR